jgi:hypothetical protein
MKLLAALAVALCLSPASGRAAALDLATLTCGKYENEVLPAAAANPVADSINTVMWLFGYSVAKSGAHVMYPEALAPFGFALDNECKSNPQETLLNALAAVKLDAKNPMDLAGLESATFAARHMEMARTDPDSASTIMMWLFGFSVAKSGSHVFDPDLLNPFQSALLAECEKHPANSLYDALGALKISRAAK